MHVSATVDVPVYVFLSSFPSIYSTWFKFTLLLSFACFPSFGMSEFDDNIAYQHVLL